MSAALSVAVASVLGVVLLTTTASTGQGTYRKIYTKHMGRTVHLSLYTHTHTHYKESNGTTVNRFSTPNNADVIDVYEQTCR